MSTNTIYEASSHTTTITEETIEEFAELSGDRNLLHTDDKWAAENTQFDGKIAHGSLVASSISAALSKLDGVIIYVDQELNFNGPVEPDTEVTAYVEKNDNTDSKFETFDTKVVDDETNVVIDGEATILRQ